MRMVHKVKLTENGEIDKNSLCGIELSILEQSKSQEEAISRIENSRKGFCQSEDYLDSVSRYERRNRYSAVNESRHVSTKKCELHFMDGDEADCNHNGNYFYQAREKKLFPELTTQEEMDEIQKNITVIPWEERYKGI